MNDYSVKNKYESSWKLFLYSLNHGVAMHLLGALHQNVAPLRCDEAAPSPSDSLAGAGIAGCSDVLVDAAQCVRAE
jgi:hypothetical protein